MSAPFSATEISNLRATLPESFETIYTSPRQRCYELATALSHDVQIAPELAELDFGDWEMRTWDEIGAAKLDAWIASEFAAVHGGESLNELDARTRNWIDSVKQSAVQSVIAVTHAGTIRSLLRQTIDLDLSASLAWPVQHLAPLHLRQTANRWQLFDA